MRYRVKVTETTVATYYVDVDADDEAEARTEARAAVEEEGVDGDDYDQNTYLEYDEVEPAEKE